MTTPDPLFEPIREAVCAWVEDVEKKYAGEFRVERIQNKTDIFLVYFFLKECAAQVIVNDPEWAPYRYVGFEVFSIPGEKAKLVFSWYDSDEDDVDRIIQQLRAGMEYAVSYEDAGASG